MKSLYTYNTFRVASLLTSVAYRSL